MNGCFFQKLSLHNFCPKIRKRFFLEVSFENQIKEHTQQAFVGLQDEDVLKTCLEDVFNTSSV